MNKKNRYDNLGNVVPIQYLTLIIPTIACIYLYIKFNYIETTNTDKPTNLIKKNDIHPFLKDVHRYCGDNKDRCLLSHEIVMNTYTEITNKGMDEYLNNIRQNPGIYETHTKDYVFIFQDNKNKEEGARGNLYGLYHPDDNIRHKYTTETLDYLTNVCGEDRCRLLDVNIKIKEMADNNKEGGFIEYYWLDPGTQERIIKRTYVKKIENIKYNDEIHDYYLGSGYTVSAVKMELDYFKLIASYLNIILLVNIWIYIEVSKFIEYKWFSITILTLVVLFLSSDLLYSYKDFGSTEYYNKNIMSVSDGGKTLAMLLGSIILYLNLFKLKNEYILYKLLLFAFMFILYGILFYASNSTEMLSRDYTLKRISIMNASVYMMLVFIFITKRQMKNK